jgi:phosphomethylpyrimidine synthase
LNAPDKLAQFIQLTREPLPASSKRYLSGSRPDIRVPVREILQSNGEAVKVYDTSGPYTDPTAHIDVCAALQLVRERWIADRGDTELYRGRKPFARGRRP